MTETEQTPSLDNWDDFTGDYLKTDIVKSWPVVVVPVSLKSGYVDDKPRIEITFLYNGRTKKLELNRTNQKFCRDAKLMPKQLIGKKLTFEKVKVRNPSNNSMVDSFTLSKIE